MKITKSQWLAGLLAERGGLSFWEIKLAVEVFPTGRNPGQLLKNLTAKGFVEKHRQPTTIKVRDRARDSFKTRRGYDVIYKLTPAGEEYFTYLKKIGWETTWLGRDDANEVVQTKYSKNLEQRRGERRRRLQSQ